MGDIKVEERMDMDIFSHTQHKPRLFSIGRGLTPPEAGFPSHTIIKEQGA